MGPHKKSITRNLKEQPVWTEANKCLLRNGIETFTHTIIVLVAMTTFTMPIFQHSLEGATKLKFVPFCSSLGALSDDILISRNQFLAKNHGL